MNYETQCTMQALVSIYGYTDENMITLNSEHMKEVLEGKAGWNEVSSFLGMFRHQYVKEFTQLRLGTGVANKKVRSVRLDTHQTIPDSSLILMWLRHLYLHTNWYASRFIYGSL